MEAAYIQEEIRRPIPGFPGYEVTNDGRVFNRDGLNMKPHVNASGHLIIRLTRADGKRVGVGVHRLVFMSFVKMPPKGSWIEHRDGNRKNNHICNLELSNVRHAY